MNFKNSFLLFTAFAAALGQTPQGVPTPDEIAHLRADYSRLNGQTFYLNGNPELGQALKNSPERVPVIRQELIDIVRGVASRLLSIGATEGQIRGAINAVQGDFAFGPWIGDGTNTPFAEQFVLNGGRSAAIAYGVMEGGAGIPDSRSVLDFFVNGDTGWRFQATAGSDFTSCTWFVSPIAAGLAGEEWYVAWGHRIGATGVSILVRLFAFDGSQTRTVWKRDGLISGEVKVSANSVALSYFREYRPLENQMRIDEVLHVTPNGLE